MIESWLLLAIAEGCLMGIMKLFHGLVGNISPTIYHVAFATLAVGIVQAAAGFAGARIKGEKLLIHRYNLAGFIVFGLFVEIATLFSFLAFQYGARADMGTNTFIVSVLIIVPAAAIARFAFREDVGMRQGAGGLIAILGGAILLSPSALAGESRIWVWWSLITMLAACGSIATAKTLSRLARAGVIPRMSISGNIFVLQFWGGLAMSICSLGILLVSPAGRDLVEDLWESPPWLVFGYAGVVAAANMGWWSCRQISFQNNAPYFFRVLPWAVCFLGTATMSGVIVFHDPLPMIKILGLILFLPAIFVHEGGWRYCHLHGLVRFFHSPMFLFFRKMAGKWG